MEEAKIWINQAEKDLDVAKYNIDGGKLEAGLFFLQQSSEKALKAVYIKKFKELLKVHDLVLLGRKVDVPKKIFEFCKKLSPAYQYTRYPDVSKNKEFEELIDDFLNYAEEILKWCKKNI